MTNLTLNMPEGRRQATLLYSRGWSLAAIAEHPRASYRATRLTLIAEGVKFRPSGHRGRLQAKAIKAKRTICQP